MFYLLFKYVIIDSFTCLYNVEESPPFSEFDLKKY